MQSLKCYGGMVDFTSIYSKRQNLKYYDGIVNFTSIYSKRQNFKYYNGIVNFIIIFRIFYLVKKAKFEILWWYSKFKNYLQNSKFKKAKFQLLLWFSKFKKAKFQLLLWFSKFQNYLQRIVNSKRQNINCYYGFVNFKIVNSKRQNFNCYYGLVNFKIIFRIFYLVKKSEVEILWWYLKSSGSSKSQTSMFNDCYYGLVNSTIIFRVLYSKRQNLKCYNGVCMV